MLRSTQRSRGTGPRATIKITPSRAPTIAGDRPPRYGCGGRLPFTVGRGPVPRHASVYRTLAGETRSDARLASEGPRATGKITVFETDKKRPLIVGRGPVPRHAAVYRTIAGDRPPRYGKITPSRNPTIAGDRPPRYGKNNAIARSNDRGGQAPALRYCIKTGEDDAAGGEELPFTR